MKQITKTNNTKCEFAVMIKPLSSEFSLDNVEYTCVDSVETAFDNALKFNIEHIDDVSNIRIAFVVKIEYTRNKVLKSIVRYYDNGSKVTIYPYLKNN